MMKTNQGLLSSLLLCLTILSCSSVSEPDSGQIKIDLIGYDRVCNWSFDSIEEFTKLEIKEKISRETLIEYEVDINVNDSDGNSRFMFGRAIYKLDDNKWNLDTFKPTLCGSIPNDRYISHEDGTVTDKDTGLMWKRCTEGQIGSSCEGGEPNKMRWGEANKHAENHIYQGHEDWRLPSKEELATLVDIAGRPSINQTIFPNTPRANVWTSSDQGFRTWMISFSNARPGLNGHYLDPTALVRLVRNP